MQRALPRSDGSQYNVHAPRISAGDRGAAALRVEATCDAVPVRRGRSALVLVAVGVGVLAGVVGWRLADRVEVRFVPRIYSSEFKDLYDETQRLEALRLQGFTCASASRRISSSDLTEYGWECRR